MTETKPSPRSTKEQMAKTAFLIMDTESIPDGRLLNAVKYPGLGLSDEAAIERAREEAKALSPTGSDFIPYTFQIPVAVCVIRADIRFEFQSIKCVDAPHFRTREIATKFWKGLESAPNASLVTFNGRGFDLPMMELAAFRYGCSSRDYFQNHRNRYNKCDIDLQDFMLNFGAARGFAGGLNLLAKLIGKPGKLDVSGNQVYEMHTAGKCQEINDYCMFDTLDTYFIFLRTRLMIGDIDSRRETELIEIAKAKILESSDEHPCLRKYLDSWSDGHPWP